MMRYNLLLTLLCLAGIPFIAYKAWPEQSPEAREAAGHYAELVKTLGGRAGFDTIRHAESVQAFRISPDDDSDGYKVDAGPIAIPRTMQLEMAALLTKPESYYWPTLNSKKGCGPVYAVRLTFHRGQDRLETNLCFSCASLEAVRLGQRVGTLELGSGEKILARFAKQLFPDDSAIQAIK